MALQPSPRPAGSTQVLRFSGAVITGAEALLDYPKNNGEVPAGSPLNVPVGVRFLLADSTDPADPTTTLPGFVYDDSQPAGVSPSAPTTGAVPAILNATDLQITDRTWCENTYVTVEPKDAASAAILTGIDFSQVAFVLDSTASSGLGLKTGKPVLVLPMILTALPTPSAPLNVDILVEVRHTASR